MENQKKTTAKTALNFGLLLGAISVVFGFILYSLDIHYQQDSSTSIIGYAIMIVIILIGIIQFKNSNEGYVSLSEALKTGVGTALVSSIIVCFYTFFMIKYLDPEFLDKSIEYQKQKMLQENPEISMESVNRLFEMQKEFSGPFIISGFIIIFNLFFGFIISLVVGLIVRKSKTE